MCLRRKLLLPNTKFDAFDASIPYVFFPLHSEPETALTLNGAHLPRQEELIGIIATALPFGVKLYVKDHPRMYGLRANSFYRRIRKKAPNVRVLNPKDDALKYIPCAKAVVIIAGTAGLEACMHGIPVIALGACHFQNLYGVKRLRDFSALPSIFRSVFLGSVNSEKMKDDVKQYLAACIEESVPMNFFSNLRHDVNYNYESEEFIRFSNYLAEKFKLIVKDEKWIVDYTKGLM